MLLIIILSITTIYSLYVSWKAYKNNQYCINALKSAFADRDMTYDMVNRHLNVTL